MLGRGAVLVLIVVVVVGANGEACNCPDAGGYCNLNCSSTSSCCAPRSLYPSCLMPGYKCCQWWSASAQCTETQSCCGSDGPGASSIAFCCTPPASCCPAFNTGNSQCCAEGQQCCRDSNSYCCDAVSESCGALGTGICVPKTTFTPNPRPTPGSLKWAANLSAGIYCFGPVVVNSTFVVAAGAGGTALIRLADGWSRFILPPTVVAPVVAGGHVIVCSNESLVTYSLNNSRPGWHVAFTGPMSCSYGPLVGYDDFLFVMGAQFLRVFDAVSGREQYALQYASMDGASSPPVVSAFETAAIAPAGQLLIFQYRTGKVLVNITANWDSDAPSPLVLDDVFVTPDVAAYSAVTGEKRFSATGAASLSALVATRNAIISFGGFGLLQAFNRSTGALLWTHGGYNPFGNPPALIPAESAVVVVVQNATGFNDIDGHERWVVSEANYQFDPVGSTGAVAKSILYLPAQLSVPFPAAVVAVDLNIGRVLGTWGAGGFILQPVVAKDDLLFMSQDGSLYCLELLA